MKRRICSVIVFLLMSPVTEGFSQGRSPMSQVAVDYGLFRGDSTRTYVELCYSFLENQLSYVQEGETYHGEVRFDVEIAPEEGADSVMRRAWLTPHEVSDTASLTEGKSLVGVVGFGLEPGKYSMKFVARDTQAEIVLDSTEIAVEVKLFNHPDRVMVSDVELCSTIRRSADRESIFYKNTLEVIPNPGGLFGVGMPTIFYYAEVYNILRGIQSENYTARTAIYDAFGNEVISKERKKSRVNESSVEVGTFEAGSLKQGTYTLVFSIIDSVAQATTSSMKRFFVYNPGSVGEDALSTGGEDVLATEYALMDESQLDSEFEKCRYIWKHGEGDQYKVLQGAEAKQRFLFAFWRSRDPYPATVVNEAKRDYFERVKYANDVFRSSFREGWKTDRGRVYILYGPPDEYDRHPSEIDTKPFETWFYHQIQGGVDFVFVDRSGFHDYELIHSTHRNELRDDNWRQQLRTN
ncbi:MAG: GWxTD domain-containing protein [Bacteroidota bacterium]